MNYFKGSRRRRRARKSTSLLINSNDNVTLETENTSSGQQAADSPENDKTQRKRSRDADKTESETNTTVALHSENTSSGQQAADSPENDKTQRKRSRDADKTESETNTTSGSKKRKAQHPRSKSYEASSSRTQTGKNKSTRKATEQSQQDESLLPAAEQSNIQLDQGDRLSRSKSEDNLNSSDKNLNSSDKNLNSSDKRDSLILCDTNEQQSDRNFLQQQIKILKTPFQLEEDCPALAKIRANDSKHIPLEVIHNTLRKVNHKTEDKILRSLNRPTQRKLLNDLQGTRPEGQDPKATCVSDEQLLETYKEVQTRVTNLVKVHDEIQQQHTQHKHIGALVSQLEAVSEEFSSKKLTEAVKRTSTLNLGQKAGLNLSDDTPRTHQQLVQILFKD